MKPRKGWSKSSGTTIALLIVIFSISNVILFFILIKPYVEKTDYLCTAMDMNQSTRHTENETEYRLGVALSGGGARGVAHAGALKALEEAGLKPDIISGVSAGSVVAVLYAAGASPDAIKNMFQGVNFSDFTKFAPGSGGLFSMEPFRKYISRALRQFPRIEDLPMPVYIGVTNFDEGVPEVFSSGNLSMSVVASCSIPIVFPPVIINGVRYVDGGVLRNLPAWTIRKKCHKLIGINVSPAGKADHTANTLVANAMRAYTLLAKSNMEYDKELCDILVQTDSLVHHKVFDLKDINSIFNSGYLAMKAELDKCKLI